ncbi:MAG: phage tail protein [Bacteroidales bacterium]|nr:phage tail protein [Bacteroidales bacterium]
MQNKDYAQFGNIKLANTDGLNKFDESVSATFVEHQLITGTPLSQIMGKDLREIKLMLSLRASMGHDIDFVVSELDKMLENKEPQHFMFADGRYKGKYTLASINSSVTQTDVKGKIISSDISITIREYVPRQVIEYKKVEEAKKEPKKEIRKEDDKKYYITRDCDKWNLISFMAYGSADYIFELRQANPTIKESPLDGIEGGLKIVIPEVKKKVKKTTSTPPWIRQSYNPNIL